MLVLESIFVFALGAICGSFFNVLILRKNTGESVLWERSRCLSCNHQLSPLDLIPIFGYFILGGKCRYCGSKFSVQYVVVEFLVALLALSVYLKFTVFSSYATTAVPYGSWLMAYGGRWLFYFSAFSSLFLVAAYDFRQKVIERHFFSVFMAFSALEAVWRWKQLSGLEFVIQDIISAFVIALFFYLVWFFSDGRWMGRGDTDIAFAAALFLGFPLNIGMLLLSFWIGGFTGILLLVFRGSKYGLKSEIPFGPFLAAATFIAWYFGSVFSFLW